MALDVDGIADRVIKVIQVDGVGEVVRCEHASYLCADLIPDLSDPVTRAILMGVEVCPGWTDREEGRLP